MASIAGKVAPVFKGDYSPTEVYNFYDAVRNRNKLWFCKRSGTVGIEPLEDSEYWSKGIDGSVGDASSLGGESTEEWNAKISMRNVTSRKFTEVPSIAISIDKSIKQWLDEHPEATTTVQDGSLESVKMHESFWEDIRIKKDSFIPQMFGAKGDGIADDTKALQDYAKKCDDEYLSSMYLPTQSNDYLIKSPIKFKKHGIKIYGDKGVSYDTGTGKHGFIIIGEESTHGIDLGDNLENETLILQDCYTVSNIGFKRDNDVAFGTKKGIVFSSQTNAPDRGIFINEISAKGLECAFYVPPNNDGVTIQGANLNIINSCISGNKIAVLNDGKIYGLRFVGNQCEQNSEHAIKGAFNGSVIISDNMLEGQPNAICITDCVADIYFVSERNYFERNDVLDSEYIYMLGSKQYFTYNTAKIGNNFMSGLETPPDKIRLTGRGYWKFEIENNWELTLYQFSGCLIYGSKIFNPKCDFYSIRSILKSPSTVIYIDNGLNKLDVNNTHTHITFNESTGVEKMTPFGKKYVANGFDKITIPTPINKNDLIIMNVLMRAKRNNYIDGNDLGTPIKIYNVTDVFVDNGDPTAFIDCSLGDWVLVSVPYHSNANLPNGFKITFADTMDNAEIDIAGIAFKNYGQFTNDGSTKLNIYPVCPII